jgi:hypothetical protein
LKKESPSGAEVVPAKEIESSGAAIFVDKGNFSFPNNFSDRSQTHAEVLRGNFFGQTARNYEKELVIVAAVKGERERVEASSTEQRRNSNGRKAILPEARADAARCAETRKIRGEAVGKIDHCGSEVA